MCCCRSSSELASLISTIVVGKELRAQQRRMHKLLAEMKAEITAEKEQPKSELPKLMTHRIYCPVAQLLLSVACYVVKPKMQKFKCIKSANSKKKSAIFSRK